MPTELDAFSADPGVDALRIQPSASDAGIRLDGSFVFCLGHDAPGFFALLKPGDYAEITQTGDFTGSQLVTFQPRTRAPKKPLPIGYSWVCDVRVDGVVFGTRTIGDGQTPDDWANWILNVSKVAAGNHALAFRLTLTGPALPPPPASPMMEVEIPAFYVEKVALVATTGPLILNQVPDSGAAQPASATTAIDFDIVDLGTNGIDTTTINATVNSGAGPQSAIVNGAFATGWTGTITSSGDTAHVHLVSNAPYPSAATVTVSVTAKTLTTATNLNPSPTSWTFHVIDNVAPVLAAAVARATTTVRVTFSETVIASSTTGAHDALNPALYSIVPQATPGGIVPAVTPTVVAVAAVNATQFDLTTDIDLSPGVPYSVTANGVSDPAGNSTLTLYDFSAFLPAQPDGRDFDLLKWIPQKNRQEDLTGSQDLRRFVACLQEVATLLIADIDRWSTVLDVDIAPEAFVDAMLQDLGNPFPFSLTLTDKRRLAQLLVAIYEQKGTPDGVINAIRFFMGIEVTITAYDGEGLILGISQLGVDWILGPGTSFARYSWRIVSPIILTADQLETMELIANYMKPAHTHLIEVVQPFPPPVYNPVVLGVSRLGVDWILH